MTPNEFESAAKRAFDTAVEKSSAPGDCTFRFKTETNHIGGTKFIQCKVEYEEGNEFFYLKYLLEQLEAIAKDPLIELRGRDQSQQESTKLCAEYNIEGVRHQIIYFLK